MVDTWDDTWEEVDDPLEPLARERLSRELDALSHEFRHVPREVLERFAYEAMCEFAGARVEIFVPLFVRRRVRQRLLSRAETGAVGGDG